MPSTTLPPPSTGGRPSVVLPAQGQRFVVDGASWSLYERLLPDVGAGPTRLTDGGGRLELTSPLAEHKVGRRLLGRLVEQLTLELEIPIASFGSTTYNGRTGGRGPSRTGVAT